MEKMLSREKHQRKEVKAKVVLFQRDQNLLNQELDQKIEIHQRKEVILLDLRQEVDPKEKSKDLDLIQIPNPKELIQREKNL